MKNTTRNNRNKSFFLSLLLVLILTGLAYINTLHHHFVWDDQDFLLNWHQLDTLSIQEALSGAAPEFHSSVYRPLRTIFYIVSFHLWHRNPLGYHFQAIIIHLLITSLIFLITYKLKLNISLALLSALFFGLHPIHTEAVAWITASFDLIAITFALLGFFLYQHSRNHPNLLTWSSSLVFISFFGNELTLITPFLIICHHLLFPTTKQNIKSFFPFFILMLVYFLFRFSYTPTLSRLQPPWPLIEQFRLVPLVLGRYLHLLVVPWQLSANFLFAPNLSSLFFLDYNHQSEVILPPLLHPYSLIGLGFMTFLIMFILRFGRSYPLVTFALLWIVISLIPVIQLLPQPILFAERYAYLASYGFVLLLALIFLSFSKSFKLSSLFPFKYLLLIIILTGYLMVTINRNLVWFDNFSLWTYTLTQNPQSASTLNSLGVAYVERGDLSTAIQYFRAAVDRNPDILLYQINLLNLYQRTGEVEALISTYKDLIQKYPQAPNLFINLGDIYYQLGDYSHALSYYKQALELDLDNSYIIDQIIKTQNHSHFPDQPLIY